MCDSIPINRHKLNTLDYNGRVTKNTLYLVTKKGFSSVAGTRFRDVKKTLDKPLHLKMIS